MFCQLAPMPTPSANWEGCASFQSLAIFIGHRMLASASVISNVVAQKCHLCALEHFLPGVDTTFFDDPLRDPHHHHHQSYSLCQYQGLSVIICCSVDHYGQLVYLFITLLLRCATSDPRMPTVDKRMQMPDRPAYLARSSPASRGHVDLDSDQLRSILTYASPGL